MEPDAVVIAVDELRYIFSEMIEVAVFPPESIPALAFPSHKKVVEEYLRSLAPAEELAPPPGPAAALRAARPSRAQVPMQSRPPR